MFYFRIRAGELRSSIDNREGGLSMDLDIGSPRQIKTPLSLTFSRVSARITELCTKLPLKIGPTDTSPLNQDILAVPRVCAI